MNKKSISFLKKYKSSESQFLRVINKEINFCKDKKDPLNKKNLILLKRFLNKTSKKDVTRIDDLIKRIDYILKSEMNFFLGLSFSGSVLKETYVHGLSDIDVFILLDKNYAINIKPNMIQKKILRLLKKRFSSYRIRKNREAIEFFIKNIKIQIVAIIPHRKGIFFPKKEGRGWNKITPEIFCNLLKKENKKWNGKLTSSIKIIKIILSKRLVKHKITGHHLEILTYLSCKNIQDKGLPIFELISKILSISSRMVMFPIKDTSKQFRFVDSYLGKRRSLRRENISEILKEVSEKIRKEELEI